MSARAAGAIANWAAQPHISARSVLVTIIGDTLIPVTSSIWMSQMLALAEVFGFNDRLVRTSMTRLVNEGWLTNERVGRQSRYLFTELALQESAQADGRIYGVEHVDWAGEWTLLFASNLGGGSRALLTDQLRWNGFIQIGSEVLASPTSTPEEARALCRRAVPDASPAVATVEFADVQQLVAEGFFTSGTDGAEIAAAYQQFIAQHSAIDSVGLSPDEAFAIRTMLVHDLRRIRLRWPDALEAEPAIELAAERYVPLSGAAAPFLSELLDVDYPTEMKGRFGAD